MKPNIPRLREWAAVLRSGKYQQGTERLRTGDTYCCLGVACDMLGISWKLDGRGAMEIFVPTQPVAFDDLVPKSVSEAFGIKNLCNFRAAATSPLWKLNDSGESFETIANYIETFCDEYEAGHSTT